MKNKLLLLLLLLSSLLFVAACSDTTSSQEDAETKEEATENKENESNEVSDEAMEEEDTSLTEEEALSIALEVNESIISAAKSDDIDAFRSLYSTHLEDTIVNQDFEFFQTKVGEHEDLAVRVLFQTDDVIGVSVYEYTNELSSTGSRNHSYQSYRLNLENIDGAWVYSTSEKVQEAFNTIFSTKLSDKYGDEFVENGFVTGAHPYLFDVVLSNGVEVELYKMKLNDDQSLDVVIAIQNGLENAINSIVFNELILGNADKIPFADLSGYELESTDIIATKTMKLVPITIPTEELLVSPQEIDMTQVNVSSNFNYVIN